MHRLRHRHCCQGVVISVVLALCLCLSIFRTYENTSSLPSLGQEYSRRSLVIPLMGTQHINASRTTILNCSQIPKNNDQWKVYAESVLKAREAEQRELEDKRKGANKNTPPLYECSVEVEVSPCSCMRTIKVHLPEPCPSTSPQHLLHHIRSTLGESACGDIATLRGTAQKVLSYSVGGRHPNEYHYGLTQLVPRSQEMYPGWIMRIYIDNSTESHTWACPLACNNPHLDFCHVTQLPVLGDVSGSSETVWRFAVLGDPLVHLYLIRDADSPLLQREVDAVNYWLRAGTCYHVMRDHFYHDVPMLAGMWGGCMDNWNSKQNILAARNVALCGIASSDQDILQRLVWPVARLNGTIHDAYTCRRFHGSLPFPTQRNNYTFVGQSTYRKRFRWHRIYKKCPRACRPKEHQDWLYC